MGATLQTLSGIGAPIAVLFPIERVVRRLSIDLLLAAQLGTLTMRRP
jgi:hypothetical protein